MNNEDAFYFRTVKKVVIITYFRMTFLTKHFMHRPLDYQKQHDPYIENDPSQICTVFP